MINLDELKHLLGQVYRAPWYYERLPGKELSVRSKEGPVLSQYDMICEECDSEDGCNGEEVLEKKEALFHLVAAIPDLVRELEEARNNNERLLFFVDDFLSFGEECSCGFSDLTGINSDHECYEATLIRKAKKLAELI